MPIMAKSNDEYTEVKAIKTPDGTEIDYVLSKVDNTYKRTYTATRELEDTPPLEFKSIKPNANLTDYRIYGQTVDGESVGDLVTSGEHAGEYSVPVTVEGKNLFDKNNANIIKGYFNSQTFNIPSYSINRTIYIPCLPNTTYTLTKSVQKTTSANRFRACTTTEIPTNSVVINDYVTYSDGTTETNLSITTGANARYLCCFIYSIDAEMAFEKFLETIQIEKNFSATPYEPYHAPITTPIYLPEQIKKVGDEAEYIDYGEQKQHRVRVNLSEVNEFSNSITDTSDTLNIWVQQGKNDYFVYPSQSKRFVITEPTAITTSITIINGNDSIRIKHNGSNNDIVIDIVRELSPGEYSVSFNILNYDHTTVGGLVINNIMVNKGSIALPYEPYITDTDLDVTLPALPVLPGTNVLSVGTEVQPSSVYLKGAIKALPSGGDT